jgi:hypothetical protein
LVNVLETSIDRFALDRKPEFDSFQSPFEKVVILSWVMVMRWSDGCMEGEPF